MDNIETLSGLIAKAARKAFLKLFENGEHFYYCVLLTTEEGFSPVISAWSWEALDRFSNEYSKEDRDAIKWSYADSPYYDFGDEYFNDVRQAFSNRFTIDQLDNISWYRELKYRLNAMELAMKQLDNDGIFDITQPREAVYINVELMPPNFSNVERALRLNNPQNITDWLNEAAET